MNLYKRIWTMLIDNAVGDTGNPGHGANQPAPPSVAPVSTAPMLRGIHVRPWEDTPAALALLDDLKPTIVRIWCPAFGIVQPKNPLSDNERIRLVTDIESQIVRARTKGWQVLLVCSSSTRDSETPADVLRDAPVIADYYAKIAGRFPGTWFEAGNEVEINGIDATTYAVFFATFATAVRASNPTAKICTAGTSGPRYSFVRDVLSHLTVHPDGIGVHPYGVAPQDYASLVAAHRAFSALPVWFTEFGLESGPDQASGATKYFAFSRGLVPFAIWFCLQDIPQTFGVVDANAVKRPSYDTVKAAFAIDGSA